MFKFLRRLFTRREYYHRPMSEWGIRDFQKHLSVDYRTAKAYRDAYRNVEYRVVDRDDVA